MLNIRGALSTTPGGRFPNVLSRSTLWVRLNTTARRTLRRQAQTLFPGVDIRPSHTQQNSILTMNNEQTGPLEPRRMGINPDDFSCE